MNGLNLDESISRIEVYKHNSEQFKMLNTLIFFTFIQNDNTTPLTTDHKYGTTQTVLDGLSYRTNISSYELNVISVG